MGNRMPKRIVINKERYLDKVKACWIGKNIGGTVGGPYEGVRSVLNIQGFTTPKGEPLPNDDLDLQLVWLKAIEDRGPYINANLLAEYWLTYITPYWNEYGIAKDNLRSNLLPPLCGEFNNPQYKHSNGAWIRTELWACLTPGFPELAKKYAFYDACVDHGLGEGTYSAMFVSALESMAFYEEDVRKLIETALSYIPEDCKTAQCVKKAIEGYENGKTFEETRNEVLETGIVGGFKWFMAPANVGFSVIGLLYGEGDFKKSMLTAINCGDDTDCTAATVGSIMGLIYGTKGIPQDWAEYIGDRIITKCINGHHSEDFPQTCSELTDRVCKNVLKVLNSHLDFEAEFGEEDFGIDGDINYKNRFVIDKALNRKPLSFDAPENHFVNAVVEFDEDPIIKPNGESKFRVKFYSKFLHTLNLECKVYVPDGFSAEYAKCVYAQPLDVSEFSKDVLPDYLDVFIKAGDKTEAINTVVVVVTCRSRANVACIPVTLLG